VLRIVIWIGISYITVYVRQGRIHWLRNPLSLLMVCKRWGSFLSDILGNQDHWEMSSEDIGPKIEILSWPELREMGWMVLRKELVQRKGGDVRRCSRIVAVYLIMIRKWSEVLQRGVMWRGNTDQELSWWCVRSWEDIRMIHWSMRNDSSVADEVYIKRGYLVLKDFLFFSLHSFSCIAKQVQLWTSLEFGLVLIPSIRTSSTLSWLRYHIPDTNITCIQYRPLHYQLEQ